MKDDTRRSGREPGVNMPLRIVIAAGLIPGGLLFGSTTDPEASPEAPPTESSTVSVLSRTSALWNNPHWAVIKDVWRYLDAVAPGLDGYGGQLIDAGEAQDLREKVWTAMQGLLADAPELGLDSLELFVLRRLTEDRLDYLSWGTMMPMTRMMPPPISGQIDEVVARLETRIDLVFDLRARGLMGSDEMIDAFGLLSDDVDLYAAQLIVESRAGYGSNFWGIWWPEDLDAMAAMADSLRDETLRGIAESGESYEGQLTEVTEIFDGIISDIEATRARVPVLNELLMDLELF